MDNSKFSNLSIVMRSDLLSDLSVSFPLQCNSPFSTTQLLVGLFLYVRQPSRSLPLNKSIHPCSFSCPVRTLKCELQPRGMRRTVENKNRKRILLIINGF